MPSPIYTGMKRGAVVRFEEVTRCQPEIQDTLVSILSEKILHVPELAGDDAIVFGAHGFNLIATATRTMRAANRGENVNSE